MKKVVLAVLSLLMIGTSAYAADAEVGIKGNTFTVKDTVEPNSEAVMVVVKKGGNINNDADILAIKQAKADSEGNVTFTFDMPEKDASDISTDGEYQIYTKEDAENVNFETPVEKEYATETTRKNVASEFDGSSNWKEEIEEADNRVALETAGCNLDAYNSLEPSAKEAVLSIVKDSTEGAVELDTFAEDFNEAITIVGLNSCTEAEAEGILETLNKSYKGKEYNSLTDAKKKWIAKSMYLNRGTGYTTLEAFENMYKIACELADISDYEMTRESNLETTLANAQAVLGLYNDSENRYAKYVALNDKTKSNELIAGALKSTPAYTVSDLLTIIGNNTKEVTGNPGSTPGGTSSTGGITVGTPVTAPTKGYFTDLDSVPWAKEQIEALFIKNIVTGDGNGTFRPNDTITREEFVRMLVVAANAFDEAATCNFEDVAADAWYASSVASAYNAGLVNGVSDVAFGVGTNITRQDFMVMSYRAVKDSGKLTAVRGYDYFADETGIADYAKEAVQALYTAGIVNGMGDGTFAPTATATRAQAALVIYNLFAR